MELHTAQFYQVTTNRDGNKRENPTCVTQSDSINTIVVLLPRHYFTFLLLSLSSFLNFRFVYVFVFLEASQTGFTPIGYSEHVVHVPRQMALTAVSSYLWIQKNINRFECYRCVSIILKIKHCLVVI